MGVRKGLMGSYGFDKLKNYFHCCVMPVLPVKGLNWLMLKTFSKLCPNFIKIC